MQQEPRFTIIRNTESLTITVHGKSNGHKVDQHIGFNCYGVTHRAVFNQFADTIMKQKQLSPEKIYTIAQAFDRKHVNVMGVGSNYKTKRGVCKIIF